MIVSDSAIHAILMDWTLGESTGPCATASRPGSCSSSIRSRNDKIPIFLMAERGEASSIPIDVMEMVDEYIWTLEDTASFVGGRVVAAIRRYSGHHAAADGVSADEVHPGIRVLLAHAGSRRRHRIPQVAGRARVLRLLRREHAPLRPLDQRGRAGLPARPHWSDRGAREATRRGCSARTAPIASPTAPRCRTA